MTETKKEHNQGDDGVNSNNDSDSRQKFNTTEKKETNVTQVDCDSALTNVNDDDRIQLNSTDGKSESSDTNATTQSPPDKSSRNNNNNDDEDASSNDIEGKKTNVKSTSNQDHIDGEKKTDEPKQDSNEVKKGGGEEDCDNDNGNLSKGEEKDSDVVTKSPARSGALKKGETLSKSPVDPPENGDDKSNDDKDDKDETASQQGTDEKNDSGETSIKVEEEGVNCDNKNSKGQSNQSKKEGETESDENKSFSNNTEDSNLKEKTPQASKDSTKAKSQELGHDREGLQTPDRKDKFIKKEDKYTEGSTPSTPKTPKSPKKFVDYDKEYPPDDDILPPSVVPVDHVTSRDVLFGRGGLTNHHPGNKLFREMVAAHKDDYMNAVKVVKPRVARKIVKAVRIGTPPGRFLKKNKVDNKWYDVGDRHASEKTSQALREKSQDEKKVARARNSESKRGNDSEDGKKKKSGSEADVSKISMPPTYPSNIPPGLILGPYAYYPMTPYYPGHPPFPYGMPTTSPSKDKDSVHQVNAFTSPQRTTDDGKENKEGKRRDNKDSSRDSNKTTVPPSPSATSSLLSSQPSNYPVEGGIFGPVDKNGDIIVTERDILCGRGGATNHHKGNKRFRDIVSLHRPDYVRAPKVQKPNVARLIVKAIRTGDPPGRFLKKNEHSKWYDIGDKKATEKSSQALREKPTQDKKTLQKLTPESVPLYMHGYVGGSHPPPHPHQPFVYAYAPIIPGQQLPPGMGEFMSTPPSLESKNQNISEKSENKEVENEDKATSGDGTERGEGSNDPKKEGDEKDEITDKSQGKRKSTNFEETESSSDSKQQKNEVSNETEITFV